jgi:hypothetical protein
LAAADIGTRNDSTCHKTIKLCVVIRLQQWEAAIEKTQIFCESNLCKKRYLDCPGKNANPLRHFLPVVFQLE